jgi:hypothetical protein
LMRPTKVLVANRTFVVGVPFDTTGERHCLAVVA